MNMNDAFVGSLIFNKDSGGGGGSDELLNAVVTKTVVDLTSDAITSVAASVFANTSSLVTVNLKNALTIGDSAFSSCANLTNVSLPNVETIGSYVFASSNALTNVTMPNVVTAGGNCFQTMGNLQSIVFPKLKDVPGGFCKDTLKVEFADFGAAEVIWNQAFWGCHSFGTLVIRTNQVCALSHVYAVNYYTRFMSGRGGGTLYVPQDLISSYQNAENWADVFAVPENKILPIEGSPYELA